MEVKLLGSVTLQGQDVHAGDVIDIPEASANSLVASGLAEETAPDEQKGTSEPPKGEGGTTNTNVDPEKAAADELARIAKALDTQYKRDELAEAAKTAGVEFPYDAVKAAIIAAVIEQGKAEVLLK